MDQRGDFQSEIQVSVLINMSFFDTMMTSILTS